MKERKRIPKTVVLNPEVYIESAKTFTKGYQIAIAGTAASTADRGPHVFLAVFNTYYNVTEFLWEDPSEYPEACRGVKFAKNSPHGSPSTTL